MTTKSIQARLPALTLAVLVLALLVCNQGLLAQQPDEIPVKGITAVRAENHPRIDGVLSDACWKMAPRLGEFFQDEPNHGEAATESTIVRVAYDNEAIYVGMEMYDSQPGKIVDRLTRRDRDQDADCALVVIDSYHDHQTAYGFLVYASGTQQDAYHFNDNNSDGGWDAVWESATKITDRGWTAEYRIPLDCLRFVAADDPVWGIQFARAITRNKEVDQWIDIPEEAGGFVSRFGHLEGLRGLHSPKQMEALPYLVSYEETEAKHRGNPDGRDYFGNMGLDLKYGITPNITLNATLNPDFGQVEADQTVLELTSFETYFPEKRPFFVEGSRIFETYFNLFYSRRVGKSPSGGVSNLDYYVDRPGATTILGAAKVTGKTSHGTSIGILEAVTQRERAKFVDREGTRQEAVVEPEANYLVARLQQDVLRNSSVGIMATAANQSTLHPAYTGGADWYLRVHDGEFATQGEVVGSLTGPGERGWGGYLKLAKEGGRNIRAYVEGQYLDRGLDLNRIGYLRRNNFKELSSWFQYRTNKKWWIVNRTWTGTYADLTENLDGLRQNYGCDLESDIEFTNYWSASVGGWVDFGKTAFDWETRGGPPVQIPMGQSWRLGFNTDGRKWWQLNPFVNGGDTWDGQFNGYRLNVNLRPRSNVELSVGPGFNSQWHISRWLAATADDEGNRRDIFGEQSYRRFDMVLRGTFTFTKDLSLQIYAQPFLAAVDYSKFKKLVPGGYEFVDASVYDESVEQPDFNYNSYNSNVVLRWEYRPGSTLFLVWTQAREASDTLGDFKFDRDWDSLFNTVPGNTFLVKANYRLSI